MRGLKFIAIASVSLLLVMAVLIGYLFLTAQVEVVDIKALGELTEEEAKEHPRKNVLMKALGANITVDVDIFDVETDIDGIMLCSDGLTNMLDEDQIAKVLSEKSSLEDRLTKLITKSNNRGGTDNISIAFLEKKDGVVK